MPEQTSGDVYRPAGVQKGTHQEEEAAAQPQQEGNAARFAVFYGLLSEITTEANPAKIGRANSTLCEHPAAAQPPQEAAKQAEKAKFRRQKRKWEKAEQKAAAAPTQQGHEPAVAEGEVSSPQDASGCDQTDEPAADDQTLASLYGIEHLKLIYGAERVKSMMDCNVTLERLKSEREASVQAQQEAAAETRARVGDSQDNPVILSDDDAFN